MSVVLFFVLAIVAAAAIVQPLLPGSRVGYPLPAQRGRALPARPSPVDRATRGPACPKCGAPVKDGDGFCVRCGGALLAPVVPLSCGACGARLAEDDLFCRKCGARTGAGEAQK